MKTAAMPLGQTMLFHRPRSAMIDADPCASEAQSVALLRSGAAYRERMQAADITSDGWAGLRSGASPHNTSRRA